MSAEPPSAVRPAHHNAPNQPQLRYRAAEYARVLRRMLERISQQMVVDAEGRAVRPLRQLSTRRADDHTLALLDAWAVLLDVLSFYTERIANEGYLLTATERRSVLELARMTGYELRPGVAASTQLVFAMDDSPGAIRRTTIPAHTQVQSLPLGGGLPQAFETSEPFTAYVDWNELRPRRSRPQRLALHAGRLVLVDTEETLGSGAATLAGGQLDQLFMISPGSLEGVTRVWLVEVSELVVGELLQAVEPGDLLLLAGNSRQGLWDVMVTHVRAATLDTTRAQTRLRIGESLSPPPFTYEVDKVEPLRREPLPLTRPMVESQLLARQVDERELTALRVTSQWSRDSLLALLAVPVRVAPAGDARGIYRFSQHLGFFGASAPPWAATVENRRLALLVNRRVGEGLASGALADAVPIHADVVTRLRFRDRIAGTAGNATASTAGGAVDDALTVDATQNWDSRVGWPIWKQHPSGAYYSDSGAADAFLEREEASLAPASWAVVEHGGKSGVGRYLPLWVKEVHPGAVTGFSLSGKATGLSFQRLASGQLSALANSVKEQLAELTTRRATIYAVAIPLTLADLTLDVPVENAAQANRPASGAAHVMLEQIVLDLRVGQRLILQGEPVDAPGVLAREVVELRKVVHRYGYTVLDFVTPLAHRYRRDSLRFYANVVNATHGATVPEEILGSANGNVGNQTFGLLHVPLTHLSASTASGAASTLEVRVDGILWRESADLFQLTGNDRAYIVRIDNEGRAAIVFGDGTHGARLPTGNENIRARYRHGIGRAGQVPAESLTLLANRAPGVRSVVNPLPAAGAADPETLDNARANAPRHLRTFGRIVSLVDFEDFARNFAGIGKAQALALWARNTRLVHLTIAAADGAQIESTSDLYQNLLRAVQRAQAPGATVVVDTFQPILFNASLAVQIEADHVKERVVDAVRSALEVHFAFGKRAFGQSVTAAEIVTVAQAVDGVRFVDLDALFLDQPDPVARGAASTALLPAPTPRWNAHSDTFRRAGLLLLNPAGLTIGAIEVLP